MRKLKICLTSCLVLALAATVFIGAFSCAEGDNEKPGKVSDLFYFYNADAVGFQGRVTQTQIQAPPADTRILAWTAPGDDDFDGEAALYDIRFVRESDVPAGVDGGMFLRKYWDESRELVNEPEPRTAGRFQQLFLPRINTSEQLWFGVRVYDEVGQLSSLGKIVGPVRIERLSVPLRTGEGAPPLAGMGAELSGAGDMNYDGGMDMLVTDQSRGRAYIYFGRTSSRLLTLSEKNVNGLYVYRTIPELTPRYVIKGSSLDEFGASAAGLGPVNGDLYDDIAVGAPAADGAGQDAGRVYLKYGGFLAAGDSILADDVNVTITGDEAFGRFGASVAAAGDLEADSRLDLVAGAPAAGGPGKAYVFRGLSLTAGDWGVDRAAVEIVGEANGDMFGAEVAGVGDVNGDGLPDLAVGAPLADHGGQIDVGAVYVFFGGAIFLSSGDINLGFQQADVTIYGTIPRGQFGRKIVGGGNLSGIGDLARELVVVGGETVYVYHGGLSGTVQFPTTSVGGVYVDTNADSTLHLAGGSFAADIASLGDLDLDNKSDLLVTQPATGQAHIYKGPIAEGINQTQPDSFDATGHAQVGAGPGDVNSDGFDDIMLSDPATGEAFFLF